jgi:hypothetical protein
MKKSEAKWKPWVEPISMLATACPPKLSAEDKVETIKVYAKLLAFRFEDQPKALDALKAVILHGATSRWEEFPPAKALVEAIELRLAPKSDQRRGSWIWKGGERVPI